MEDVRYMMIVISMIWMVYAIGMAVIGEMDKTAFWSASTNASIWAVGSIIVGEFIKCQV